MIHQAQRSRNVNSFMQKNKKVKPTVAFLTTDWAWGTDPLQPNGCAWYRSVLPGVELEKRGWICGVGLPAFNGNDGFGMHTTTNKAVHGWDIIVFKLIMHKDALDNLPRAIELGQKVVVDVDDFFDGLSPTNNAYQATDPEKHPDNNRQIYAEIIKNSFAITTSTQFLYDYYSKIHKNVFLVKNGIDLGRYQGMKKFASRTNKTKIGWVGATPWRSNDLEILTPFIGDYLRSKKGVWFHHSGHIKVGDTAATKLNIDPRIVSLTNLCPISDYPQLFSPIDIGIVPLNDIPFNHAKSYIKGLEYAASGIPFIASDLPEYRDLFESGIGRLATTPDEWIYHFDELLDRGLRMDEAQVNLDILQDFSMQKRGVEWEQVFTTILDQSI